MGPEVKTVVVLPLDVADPDDDGGEFVGVDVGFDAVELLGAGARQESGEAVRGGEDADFFFEVENLFEGYIEEVAAAAGGIEHPRFRQLRSEAHEQIGERLARLRIAR